MLECLEDTKDATPTANVEDLNSLVEIMDKYCNVGCEPGSSKLFRAIEKSPLLKNYRNPEIFIDETNKKSCKERTNIVSNWLPVQNNPSKEIPINDFVSIRRHPLEESDKFPCTIGVSEIGSSAEDDIREESTLGTIINMKNVVPEDTLPSVIALPGMAYEEDLVRETPITTKCSKLSGLSALLDKHS